LDRNEAPGYGAFFLIGFLLELYKLIFEGDTEIFKKLVDGIFDTGTKSVTDVAFPLAGTMIFFLGLLNIGEKAGLIRWLAKKIEPFFSRLFPEVPKDHPATGHMVNVFDSFSEGAKTGFDVILKIIPYLVGMLVVIRVFRESGALNYLIDGLTWVFHSIGVNTNFVDALPVAIMKPFS